MGNACCASDAVPNQSKAESVSVAAAEEPPEPRSPAPKAEEPERSARSESPAKSEEVSDNDPSEFTITLTKKGPQDKIGADVARAPDFLVILKVKPGLIADYNSSASPSRQVKPNDQVMSANGVEGDSSKILQEISAQSTLRMRVVRRPPREN
mmetsp:Transcript_92099/g.269489  ORF Transcript_92099/g.269489 Transcript_92099/m.269489 type:complete len:153 (+) Transcript_92099:92-550(+)